MNPFLSPTRHLFFTGKGGVGKTALSCATAISLADRGKRVLIVSTDPASNLDEMLGVSLGNEPVAVPDVPNLFAMNIDPEIAAEAYRLRVIAPYEGVKSAEDIRTIREQLSGACTTEIAAFDEFAGLLAGSERSHTFDHIVFDTAPTGHTLRLLRLPRAWTSFLESSSHGASCLGPHSGLTMQHDRFRAAMSALTDPAATTLVLVTRPNASALAEAGRTAAELRTLGINNQMLLVNAVFHATSSGDPVAQAFEKRGAEALASLPESLTQIPRYEVPLRSFNMVGLAALRALFDDRAQLPQRAATARTTEADLSPLSSIIAELTANDHGLIMVMGKGGVGKTTIAAAIAVELAARGIKVHLSTTDPAAHVAGTVSGTVDGLTVSRIDPRVETEAYIARVMAKKGANLDDEGRALLEEDLRSPCTEEVAVFHAFSKLVSEARNGFVVLDTAPTGHTLLLLDATGAYHRDVLRGLSTEEAKRLTTPLMRLQNPEYTKILLVTLPETTPVSEAAGLQEDLRRAKIEPFAWVINSCMAATGTHDPLLLERIPGELEQVARVRKSLAQRVAIVPWMAEPPIGAANLRAVVAGSAAVKS